LENELKVYDKVDQYPPNGPTDNYKNHRMNGKATNKNLKLPSSSISSTSSSTDTSSHAIAKLLATNETIKSNKQALQNMLATTHSQILPSTIYSPGLLNCSGSRISKCKINEQQVTALEAVFKQKQYLNQFEKDQLSSLLSITPLQVASKSMWIFFKKCHI
jgi:hypothetical protein